MLGSLAFYGHRVSVELYEVLSGGGIEFVSRSVLKALDFPGDYSCPGHILQLKYFPSSVSSSHHFYLDLQTLFSVSFYPAVYSLMTLFSVSFGGSVFLFRSFFLSSRSTTFSSVLLQRVFQWHKSYVDCGRYFWPKYHPIANFKNRFFTISLWNCDLME